MHTANAAYECIAVAELSIVSRIPNLIILKEAQLPLPPKQLLPTLLHCSPHLPFPAFLIVLQSVGGYELHNIIASMISRNGLRLCIGVSDSSSKPERQSNSQSSHLHYTIPPAIALTFFFYPLYTKIDVYKVLFLIAVSVPPTASPEPALTLDRSLSSLRRHGIRI